MFQPRLPEAGSHSPPGLIWMGRGEEDEEEAHPPPRRGHGRTGPGGERTSHRGASPNGVAGLRRYGGGLYARMAREGLVCGRDGSMRFDGPSHVIVVGGGHAGCEAALASARWGEDPPAQSTAGQRGHDALQPSIGAPPRALTGEVDALGGEQALPPTLPPFTSGCSTPPRRRRQALRAQCDLGDYHRWYRRACDGQAGLEVMQDEVTGLWVDGERVRGLRTGWAPLRGPGGRDRHGDLPRREGPYRAGLLPVGTAGTGSAEARNGPPGGGLQVGRLRTGTTPGSTPAASTGVPRKAGERRRTPLLQSLGDPEGLQRPRLLFHQDRRGDPPDHQGLPGKVARHPRDGRSQGAQVLHLHRGKGRPLPREGEPPGLPRTRRQGERGDLYAELHHRPPSRRQLRYPVPPGCGPG